MQHIENIALLKNFLLLCFSLNKYGNCYRMYSTTMQSIVKAIPIRPLKLLSNVFYMIVKRF